MGCRTSRMITTAVIGLLVNYLLPDWAKLDLMVASINAGVASVLFGI